MTAAIISDKGAWSGAAGVDRAGVKLDPHAMFAIASISKTFTAAEVMLQAAGGRVNLDAPLSKYLGHRLARNNATVRQVLGMRSGLPDFTDTENSRLIHAMLAACSTHWAPKRTLSYARAALATPDTRTVYSNPNYLLLALLLKQVTGHDPAQLYRTDLFRPAGLARIAAQDREAPAVPVALPAASIHRSTGDPYIPCRAIASGFADTAGGLAADAPTIARWGYELYGGRVLPPRVVTTMVTPLNESEIFPNVKYGLGTEVFHVAFGTDDSFGHIGSHPGYSTMVAVTPARHLAAAVFIAADGKNPYQIMKDLLAAVR